MRLADPLRVDEFQSHAAVLPFWSFRHPRTILGTAGAASSDPADMAGGASDGVVDHDIGNRGRLPTLGKTGRPGPRGREITGAWTGVGRFDAHDHARQTGSSPYSQRRSDECRPGPSYSLVYTCPTTPPVRPAQCCAHLRPAFPAIDDKQRVAARRRESLATRNLATS